MRHLTGHDLSYPEPRYKDIVGMHSANYRWLPLPQAPGASVKHLGFFNEAETHRQTQWPARFSGAKRPDSTQV